MPTSMECLLQSYNGSVRSTDPHAAHHLSLLAEVQRLLAGPRSTDAGARQALAAQLERWRYQLLNQSHRSTEDFRPEHRGLSDAIDLAANELAGRPPRPPRAARTAISAKQDDGPAMLEPVACLSQDVPLDHLVHRAAQLTRAHFGPRGAIPPSSEFWRILLYAPLYLSSQCINHCTYCGFRYPNKIERKHLDLADALHQGEILYRRGFRHILLVAGDYPSLTTTDYFAEIVRKLADCGIEIAVEIAPQATHSYSELAAAGACGVTLYQETYDEQRYTRYHPRGSKASYDWRLEGLERAAEAGIRRLGLGILLGLADPREDFLSLIRHGRYLQRRFPDRLLAFSLPRIREAPDGFVAPHPIDDETFIRMYSTLRIAFPDAMLVLSTREAAPLRNRLARICATQLSAGSSTSPGGYEDGSNHTAQQFPVHDLRSATEVARGLQQSGFEVVWRCDPLRSARAEKA